MQDMSKGLENETADSILIHVGVNYFVVYIATRAFGSSHCLALVLTIAVALVLTIALAY